MNQAPSNPPNTRQGATHSARSTSDSASNEVLVRVENVSKIFCRDFKKSLKYGLLDSARDLFSAGPKDSCKNHKEPSNKHQARTLRDGEFYAVQDISFELKRGECLGLIGRNGAGKTTLLKMLNGLIKPDHGRIEMRGRIGALIALGSGFNPLLTGRENIYVNGSVLGLGRKEIETKIDEIIDFAEIREFIDAPVQSYSSGMQVRLGFAIATALEPDVLILDEVLAVGDTAFKVKCFRRIANMKRQCATIFVSHEALQVARVCSRATWLENGRHLQTSDNVQGLLSDYEQKINESFREQPKEFAMSSEEVSRITINNAGVTPDTPFRIDTREDNLMSVYLPPLDIRPAVEKCELRLFLLDGSQNPVATIRSEKFEKNHLIPSKRLREKSVTSIKFPPIQITDGIYCLRVAVLPENEPTEFIFFQEVAVRLVAHGRGREWCHSLIFADFQTTNH